MEFLVIRLDWWVVRTILILGFVIVERVSYLGVLTLSMLCCSDVALEFGSDFASYISIDLLDEFICVYLAFIEILEDLVQVGTSFILESFRLRG